MAAILNSYDNTEELLADFPVINPTPVTTPLEENIQNRLLTGFANWNLGTEAWMEWGNILYTPDSLYNVHGVHLTLKEYQATSALSFKMAQMMMGNFNNMLICGDWCAIRYDISSTDRRTGKVCPGSVMEFVNFKNYGEGNDTRVVEGWAGTKGADYAGLMRFLNAEEAAKQNEFMDHVASMTLPNTDELCDKYPTMHETPVRSEWAEEMKNLILKDFDAYNNGTKAWDEQLAEVFAPDFICHTDAAALKLDEYKDMIHGQQGKVTRLYFENMLLSGEWAAIHYRVNIMNEETGKKEAGNVMEFLHFEKTDAGLRVREMWHK